jgi:hypothetical protein
MRLQAASSADKINWCECRLGERVEEEMKRRPYDGITMFPKHLYLLDGNYDRINWFYAVTFGERQESRTQ